MVAPFLPRNKKTKDFLISSIITLSMKPANEKKKLKVGKLVGLERKSYDSASRYFVLFMEKELNSIYSLMS